jgi:phage-related protein
VCSSDLQKVGVNTELVMGSMRIALGKFAKEGVSAPETLRTLVTEIRDMQDPTQAAARAIEVFGQRAGADMADTIRGGKFEIDALLESIGGSNETIGSASADVMTFSERWSILSNNFKTVAEPAITSTMNALNTGLDFVMRNGNVFGPIAAGIGALAAGLGVAKIAMAAFNLVAALNPFVAVGLAIAALVTGLVVFFTKTETGRKIISTVWKAIKSAVSTAADAIGKAISAVTDALGWVGDKISWLWDKAKAGFDGIKSVVELMWTGVKVVWDKFTGALSTVGDKVGAFKDTLVKAFNVVKDTVSAVWDKIGGILDRIGDGISKIRDAGGTVLRAIGLGGNAAGGVAAGPGYASGGRIYGPGSGTSDSILGFPAMVKVSNGEYVINAESTRKFLPLLHAINGDKLPGFKGGGTVALGNISGPGITTKEQQSMWDSIRSAFPKAVLSSATRTVMTEGHPDFHNAGRAIDLTGPGMGQMAAWIADNYPDSLELIYHPFGNNIKIGRASCRERV